MKPHFGIGGPPPHPRSGLPSGGPWQAHHHAGGAARWRRKALLVVGLVTALVIAANIAMLLPLLRADRGALRRGAGGAGAAAADGFLETFDADGDGVLDEMEFQRIVAVRSFSRRADRSPCLPLSGTASTAAAAATPAVNRTNSKTHRKPAPSI
jgi:hypothetical protein